MRTRAAAVVLAAALLAAAAVTGCGGSTEPAIPLAPAAGDPGSPLTYVAVGASETVGAGIGDDSLRLRDAWPQLFYNDALPRAATYVNLGIPGATTDVALARELGPALALHPSVVTVWLNVNDLARGIPVAEYEAELDQLVRGLRQGGRAEVLVANTPVLSHLPAFLACAAEAGCLFGAVTEAPTPASLDAAVDAYNAAITRVARREGAAVVDLHAEGDIPVLHPDWVAPDGLHPSFLGHAQVARLFAAAYRAGRGAGP